MNNPDPKKVTIGDYFLPKNWIILLLLGLTRIISILPFKALLGLGSVLGSLLYLLPSSRKNIARRNIELCFPDLSEKEQDDLLRKHFASLGIGFLEVGIARWKSNKSLKKIVKVEGIEYLKEAVKKGFANNCFKEDKLEKEVLAIAKKVAQVPPELQAMNKRAVHRQMEAMGMRAGIRAGTEIQALAMHSKATRDHLKELSEGLTKALTKRDSKFGDYRTSKKKK